MLLKITNHCEMMCKHCLSDSIKNNDHMPFDTIIKSVALTNSLAVKVLVVSGGEPTDHPLFFDIINYITMNSSAAVVTVTSHGQWMMDDALMEKYRSLNVTWQITRDKRYYTKPIDYPKLKSLCDEDERFVLIEHIPDAQIYPQGRAASKMKLTSDSSNFGSPKCYNLRSLIVGSKFSLTRSISEMESRNKFCTPAINSDGTFVLGESELCPGVGSVEDTPLDLTAKIRCDSCNDCDFNKKLSPLHLIHIQPQ